LPEKELRYAPTHEWVSMDSDAVVSIGITDFAQDQLGDIVFLELPEPGAEVNAGQPCATVESVKTASDIHSPVTGIVVEINQKAVDSPELINEAAWKTWLFKIKVNNPGEFEQLLNSDDYHALISDD